MNKSYKIVYSGNKHIDQRIFHICDSCNKELSDVPSQRVNKFKSQTCSACGKTIRKGAGGKERPDFSSFIITILEHMTSNVQIIRLSREKEVKEMIDGAAKMSRAVTERHDAVQAHTYTDELDIRDSNPKGTLSSIDTELSKAYNSIKSLDNFDAEVSTKEDDGFLDVYVIFYHINAGP